MLVFIVLIILILVLPQIHTRLRGISIVFISLGLLLVCGLRSYTVGLNDTQYIYLPAFEQVKWLSAAQIFSTYKDPFYYLLMKGIAAVTPDFQVWIFLNAIPPIVATGFLINKLSRNVTLSYLLYLPTLYVFHFYLVRQSVALSFILIALYCLIHEKYVKAILLIGVSCLFHAVSAVFLVAVILRKFHMRTLWEYVVLVLCFLFVSSHISDVFNYVFTFISEQRFAAYKIAQLAQKEKDTYSYLLIAVFLFTASASVVYYNTKSNPLVKNHANDYLFFLKDVSFIATILLCFTQVLGEVTRLSQFFVAANLILLPNALAEIKDRRIAFLLNVCIGIAAIAYLLSRSLSNTQVLPFSFG